MLPKNAVDIYYMKLERMNFICNNFDLIYRCIERANLIYEYRLMEDFLEIDELIEEYETTLNLDSYIYDLPSKRELEERELGFL